MWTQRGEKNVGKIAKNEKKRKNYEMENHHLVQHTILSKAFHKNSPYNLYYFYFLHSNKKKNWWVGWEVARNKTLGWNIFDYMFFIIYIKDGTVNNGSEANFDIVWFKIAVVVFHHIFLTCYTCSMTSRGKLWRSFFKKPSVMLINSAVVWI